MNNIKITIRLVSILCTMMLASCATTGTSDSKNSDQNRQEAASVLENIQSALDEANQPATTAGQLPDDVSEALLPNGGSIVPLGQAQQVEPRFDISVNRARARTFFMSLTKDTPYNMMVHPDVKGRITLNLKDVTIPEVMEMTYNMYGYEYESSPNGFIVHPNKLQSRIFKINYLNVKRLGKSSTRVSSGQLTESSRSESSNDINTTTQSSRQQVIAASNIETESDVDFWAELQTSVETIIGQGDDRSVVISPQSGLIIVRGYPSELRKVQQYLQAAQIIMQRQVILEAKVIEVELKDGYQQGINWANLSDSGKVLTGATGGGTLLSEGQSIIEGSTGNLDPNNFAQLAGNATSAFGGLFTVAVNTGNFRAFFEFLETQGNMQVLSSPRVSTVNNQKAVIKVGSDEFFVTDISTTTTGGVTSTTTPDITLTPFFSGISLDVTPQIDEEGSIILHIHPTISDVIDQEKVINVGTQILALPLAFSQVRESDSIVRARNGQIVVIGGLMTNKLVEKEAGIPLLSSIPFLGELFKHRSDEEIKSELVILLKPIVIDDDDAWGSVIGESSNRVKQIYHEYND